MRSYDTDITEAQWARIAFCFTQPEGGPGRKRTIDTRRVVDALFYRMRTGCQWRFMPSDFPPYRSVHYYFMKWTRDGTIDGAHRLLRDQERVDDGRDPAPTAAVLDSQTAQSTCVSQETGYDGAKKKKGRKRHLFVDTMGNLLVVVTHAASISEHDGAQLVLERAQQLFPSLRRVWVDSGYRASSLAAWKDATWPDLTLEVVERPKHTPAFVVLPRRWVVERTFSWLGTNRLLSKEYERFAHHTETWMTLASIFLFLERQYPRF